MNDKREVTDLVQGTREESAYTDKMKHIPTRFHMGLMDSVPEFNRQNIVVESKYLQVIVSDTLKVGRTACKNKICLNVKELLILSIIKLPIKA
jgi:hypothetical protein